MADEDLRRLERDAAAGDTGATVRLALTLERDGRRAEAARMLLSVVDDAAARDALARFPAWSHDGADAGRTRWLDVEPVTRTPRVLWKTKLDVGNEPRFETTRLVASPLGVVAPTRRAFAVFDPTTGARRWQAKSWAPGRARWAPRFVIEGDELVASNGDSLRRFDLVTGEERGALEVPGLAGGIVLHGNVHAISGREVVARAISSGRGEPLWSRAIDIGTEIDIDTERAEPVLRAAGDMVFVLAASKLNVLDRRTGEVRFEAAAGGSFVADADGSVVVEVGVSQRTGESTLVLREASGRVLHRLERYRWLEALSPRFILVDDVDERPSPVVAIDRATGEARALPLHGAAYSFPLIAVRDVIYGAGRDPIIPTLAACRMSGEPLLWEFAPEEVVSAEGRNEWTLAALDRVLYVRFADGTLVALTDLPGEERKARKPLVKRPKRRQG